MMTKPQYTLEAMTEIKIDPPIEITQEDVDRAATTVYHMVDGRPTEYAVYILPPKEAIVAAWEQHHGNNNTWEYAKKLEAEFYPLKRGKYGWTLGKFWVNDTPK